MTGFGRGESTADGITATVEITSVNRKQFDCQVTLPRNLASLDARVQAAVRTALTRGYVKVSVTAGREASAAAAVDLDRWRHRIAAVRAAAAELGLADDLTASTLLRFAEGGDPEMPETKPEAAWAAIGPALAAAVAGLCAMRLREGAALRADLLQRLGALRTLAGEIAGLAPQVPRRYREVLRTRIAELMDGQGVAPEAEVLAREVALFADRCDISEELARLASHFDQAAALLDGDAPCGRPLDFLCQEFFREINTIGAKANDGAITRHVIAFKAGLEAVREQVQNIE